MTASRLLVVTADPDVLDDALRWSAAVGAAPEVAHDVVAARRAWVSAGAVLVASDLAAALARTAPPRRDGVLVLDAGDADPPWPSAVDLGASAVLRRSDEADVVERLGELLDGRGEACGVAVVGAAGGAGASTFAVVLASVAAGRGHAPLLLDADPCGAGLDLVAGAEGAEGSRWADLGGAGSHVGATRLARLLPRHDDVAVLSCGRDGAPVPMEAVPHVLTAASRAFDVVVADVPRHPDPLGSAVLGRCAGAVLMVPEDVRAVAAARLLRDRVHEHVPLVALVTVRRRGGLGSASVGEALGLPVVGRVGTDRGLRSEVDHGRGPTRSRTLRRAAGRVLDLLGLEEVR